MLSALKGPGEVEAEILMTRLVHRGSFLVVEGDDDSRFWSARTRALECEIVIAGGKTAVTGAIERLDTGGFKGALGIVDDDCDSLLGKGHASPNICVTDARDLEGILLRSTGMAKVIAEYGDRAKVAACVANRGPLVDALHSITLPYGRLRWVAYLHQLAIDFKPLSPARFVDVRTWTLDEAGLYGAVVAQGAVPDVAALQAAVAALPVTDPWRVSHGHDAVHVLSIGLGRFLGNKEPGRDKVGASLRLALERVDLEATALWRAIMAWEAANPTYVILA